MHKYSRKEYLKYQPEIIVKRRLFRKNNKEKINMQQRTWYVNKNPIRLKIKEETLTHYGNGKLSCVKCGFSNVRALTLDHIIPIGREKRRTTGVNFYKILQRQNYPEGYQTLCANCQMIKMFEGNEWKLS